MMALSATLEGCSQMTLLAHATRARLMKRTERKRPNSECPNSSCHNACKSHACISNIADVENPLWPKDVGKENTNSYLGVGIRVSATLVGREKAFPGRNGHGPSILWVRKPLGVESGRVEDSDEVSLDGLGHGFVLCFHRVDLDACVPVLVVSSPDPVALPESQPIRRSLWVVPRSFIPICLCLTLFSPRLEDHSKKSTPG